MIRLFENEKMVEKTVLWALFFLNGWRLSSERMKNRLRDAGGINDRFPVKR